MPTEPDWLDPREDRAWRAFQHVHHQLTLRLRQHLLQDSGLTEADYEILAVLSEHPTGHMPAQELSALVQWEKSRLSHQVRRMQERGLIAREPNPADGRSAMICLLPAGRRAIKDTSITSAGISPTCSPPPNSTPSPPSTNESCITSPRKPGPKNPLPTSPRSRTERLTGPRSRNRGGHTARTRPQHSPTLPGISAPRAQAH
jgi:DNA-binding MarR family transcriptional regulator